MARKITTADIPQNVRKKSRKVFCGMFYEFVHVHGFGLAWTRLNYYVYVEAEALDGWQFVILHMQQQQKTYFRTYMCRDKHSYTQTRCTYVHHLNQPLYSGPSLFLDGLLLFLCGIFVVLQCVQKY